MHTNTHFLNLPFITTRNLTLDQIYGKISYLTLCQLLFFKPIYNFPYCCSVNSETYLTDDIIWFSLVSSVIPCLFFKCNLNDCLYDALPPHIGQLYCFFWVCIAMWPSKLDLTLKPLPHTLQWYEYSPKCNFLCFIKLFLLVKVAEHALHCHTEWHVASTLAARLVVGVTLALGLAGLVMLMFRPVCPPRGDARGLHWVCCCLGGVL